MAVTDYLGQAGIAVQGATTAQINAVNTWLATLSDADRQSAITTLQGGENAGIFGDMTLPWSKLNPMPVATLTQVFTKLQGQFKAPAAPSPATGTAAQIEATATQNQATATTSATATTGTLGETVDLGIGQGPGIAAPSATGAEPAAGSSTPPTGFNEILATYNQNALAQAGNDPTALAQIAGMTPENLQSQYAAYQAGIQKSLQGPNQLLAHQRTGNQGANTTLTLQQFAAQKQQNLVGPWAAVLSAIGEVWQSQMDQPLPPDLAMQIVTQLNGLPPDQQQTILYNAYNYMENAASAVAGVKGGGAANLRDLGGSYTTALLDALPSQIMTYSGGSGSIGTGSVGSSGIVGTYAAVHPSAFMETQTVEQDIASAFQSALNRPPSAADLAALGTDPTPAQIQTYLDNQPMPGYPGMTYGAYEATSKSVTPQWEQIFGHDPTPAQLAYFVGKDSTEIQDFINNSQSQVPGITIGRYDDYLNYVQSLDTASPTGNHAFSQGVDASLMTQLHGAVTKAATGKATPGPMP